MTINYDKLVQTLKEEDLMLAEITTYHNNDGRITKRTVTIDYDSDGDYHWTISNAPLN